MVLTIHSMKEDAQHQPYFDSLRDITSQKPEEYKHRKRTPTSLSREVLLSHSRALFTSLRNTFGGRPSSLEVRNNVEQLARSLASYVDLLLTKRVRMEDIHSAIEVVRTVGKNMMVSFTELCLLPPTFLLPISKALKDLDPNTPLELGNLLPSDQCRRYEWLQALIMGLDVPHHVCS